MLIPLKYGMRGSNILPQQSICLFEGYSLAKKKNFHQKARGCS